jgi:molybdate transport system ATP-binding protein
MHPEHRKIGYVPQHFLLFPHLSVFDNVAFGLKQLKYAKSFIAKKVEETMELCNIKHLVKRYPHDLSGGEKQRVSLSRAIVTHPSLLLLDEPFSALDIQTKRIIRSEVLDILRAASIPSIMVTHDPMDALTFGKQVYIMEQGKLIQNGPFDALRKNPRTRFVAEFTGLTAYQGISNRESNGMLRVKLQEGVELKAVGNVEGRVLVFFDPTDISVSKYKDKSNGSIRNCLSMRITELHEDFNGICRLHLRGDLDLNATISSEAQRQLRFRIGDPIYASIKATAIRIEALHQ